MRAPLSHAIHDQADIQVVRQALEDTPAPDRPEELALVDGRGWGMPAALAWWDQVLGTHPNTWRRREGGEQAALDLGWRMLDAGFDPWRAWPVQGGGVWRRASADGPACDLADVMLCHGRADLLDALLERFPNGATDRESLARRAYLATGTGEEPLPVLCAAAADKHKRLVAWLIEAGADPNGPDGRGAWPLHHARSAPMAKALLRGGAHAGAVDGHGRTALEHWLATDRPWAGLAGMEVVAHDPGSLSTTTAQWLAWTYMGSDVPRLEPIHALLVGLGEAAWAPFTHPWSGLTTTLLLRGLELEERLGAGSASPPLPRRIMAWLVARRPETAQGLDRVAGVPDVHAAWLALVGQGMGVVPFHLPRRPLGQVGADLASLAANGWPARMVREVFEGGFRDMLIGARAQGRTGNKAGSLGDLVEEGLDRAFEPDANGRTMAGEWMGHWARAMGASQGMTVGRTDLRGPLVAWAADFAPVPVDCLEPGAALAGMDAARRRPSNDAGLALADRVLPTREDLDRVNEMPFSEAMAWWVNAGMARCGAGDMDGARWEAAVRGNLPGWLAPWAARWRTRLLDRALEGVEPTVAGRRVRI